ncbi:family 43 glycosylhydrolase [Streptomyces caniscabiei]|uniref:Family 43 glycosylhydrolase n=1 Tax=Streptomyces caniscabiei TaxID=2746961 RepID=A0ABU4N6V2_9ACTN|nr:family 43 glycosylhydrolase [Streptomyces caniscabiei]MBE4739773.1 family 43 glycosylhydrolase [Streptomyces caniscabiei]MDX2948404.1 family 43 glycosylhydrolase [Streptomyces caniscabiei]MDX2957690.1 family 43 glycosylhydrolase [Streptomyces caniscabiei]MDX2989063.1 family 43 glycosylhydrolase [Streptomyces caniscabiei]MDX3015702.1 family 43 glycosylhydrolase [Streptomyces caniscabiei]
MDLARHRPGPFRGAAPLPARRLVVPGHRRRRHRPGPRGVGRTLTQSRGLFEAAPHNPAFSHRSTAHPVQNAGHADLVERPDGTWEAVYLGTRPRGRSPRFHVNGRETFLADVSWVEDWPHFRPASAGVPTGQRDFEDDFSALGPHLRWVSPGERPDRFVRSVPEGVVVRHTPSETGEPSGLFTRVGGDHWEADFLVDPGEGVFTVALRLDGAHWYGLRVADGEVTAVARIGQIQTTLGSGPLPDSPVSLRIRGRRAAPRGHGVQPTAGASSQGVAAGAGVLVLCVYGNQRVPCPVCPEVAFRHGELSSAKEPAANPAQDRATRHTTG